MVSSQLTATGYCTRCGHGLIHGACPTGCGIPAPRSPVLFAPRPSPTPQDHHPSVTSTVCLLVLVVICGLAAALGLVRAVRAQQAADATAAALDRSDQEQRQLRLQLEDLTTAHRALDTSVAKEQASITRKLDHAGVVKRSAKSVFTVLTRSTKGSGFVVASDGGRSVLITNFHVVSDDYLNGDRQVTVRRGDLSYPGTVSEISESNDLAVISVAQALPVLPVAKHRPSIGDTLLVLGSPLGLGGTVTSGIASAYRKNDGLTFLQFSAPISPGNSGGPLVNESGRVVGVTDWKYVKNGVEGLSFAIPAHRLCSSVSVC